MADSDTCIYCGARFDPTRGVGDHIIPVQLGEFKGDVRFRRICPSCNNAIGRSEQQFLRCGPASFFREVVKPKVPPKRKRGGSPAKAAMGAPGPESTIDHGDHHELVVPCEDSPTNVIPVDQIVIHDDTGKEYFIRLFHGMRPEQLKDRVKKTGVGRIQEGVWFHCDEARIDEFRRLLRDTWPDSDLRELPPMEAGIHPIRGRTTLTVTDHYFRAIAKIGFHYYLAHTRRGYRGSENFFASIRTFIMNGGENTGFFQQRHPTFAMPYGGLPMGGVITPSRWCHVMAADESEKNIVVYLQFFVGPGCVPPAHYLALGETDSPLVLPGFTWGHVFLYDDPPSSTRYAGSIEQARITRLR